MQNMITVQEAKLAFIFKEICESGAYILKPPIKNQAKGLEVLLRNLMGFQEKHLPGFKKSILVLLEHDGRWRVCFED